MKTVNSSPAYQEFLASMQITVEEWREGIGYNLEALERVTDAERDSIVQMLAHRLETNPDWREIEALGAIGTPAAKKAIQAAAKNGDAETRMRAAAQLHEMGEPADLEKSIIDALRNTAIYGGLTQALDLAEEHPSPRIQETLLDLALNGAEEQRIHCAALALYLGGKADEAFDWNHRPFFLRFGEEDRTVQIEAYKELCRRLGVKPKVN